MHDLKYHSVHANGVKSEISLDTGRLHSGAAITSRIESDLPNNHHQTLSDYRSINDEEKLVTV